MGQALKKYNLKGDVVGELSFKEEETKAHPQMIKDYIVAIRRNMRQWSACTKGRSEVSHSTKKPHPQKGTGGARQGSLAAPQYRGGGIVFGPKPKFDQHVRINRKERRKAISYLVSQKVKENRIFLIDNSSIDADLKAPKTKVIANFLKKQGILGRSILFVGQNEGFKLSARNIPRSSFAVDANVNGYDLLASQYLVMNEESFQKLTQGSTKSETRSETRSAAKKAEAKKEPKKEAKVAVKKNSRENKS